LETFHTAAISQTIRQIYRKRLFLPVIYLLVLAALWLVTPISELVFPHQVSSEVPFRELRANHYSYISTTLTDLHFTGYTQKILGYTNGYYYYTFQDGQCLLVLLAPATCDEGLPDIRQLHVQVHVIRHFEEYDTLTQHLAEDLDWTASGIRSQIPDYLLSEPGSHRLLTFLLLGLYFFSGAYALAALFTDTAYIWFPAVSPACRKLGLYGNANQLLAQAESELAASLQFTAGDVYITQNYFIALTDYQAAIVPIREIVWIYKRSTLHKILWYPLDISYTLHITAKKRLHIQYPNTAESEIDAIIACLSKANHEILTGFNEQNRQQAQELAKRSRRP